MSGIEVQVVDQVVQVYEGMGPDGPPGQGLPSGGTTGQQPRKASNMDYDVEWVDPPAGSGDVVGPAVSVDDRLAGFNGTTGKLLRQGTKTLAQVATHLDSTANPHGTTAVQVGADPTGTAAAAVAAHAGAADPHADRAFATAAVAAHAGAVDPHADRAFATAAVAAHAAAAGAHEMAGVNGLAAALALLAPLLSPALTGNPTAPTQSAGNSSTRLATTAFVAQALADLIGSVPGTLDTLDELAAALGDDPNFAATIAASIATKLAKASNLSDLTDAAAALTNLGGSTLGKAIFAVASAAAARTLLQLGGAALLAVGTTAGTVAAGDDARITGAVPSTRTVAGAGLVTGGGDLSANRTLTVGAASAADVNTGTSAAVAMTPASYKDSTPFYVDVAADKTLQIADANVNQRVNSASAIVLTLALNATVAYPARCVFPGKRSGAGTVTIDAVAGVTLNGVNGGSCTVNTRYQGFLIENVGVDAFEISGDVSAVA